MTDWSTEKLHADYAQSLRVDRLLYDSETAHQQEQEQPDDGQEAGRDRS